MSMSRVSGLGRLSNRLDDEMQAKILGAIHTRVPMPTVDGIRALQLEHAKEHETAWRVRHTQTEGSSKQTRPCATARAKWLARGSRSLLRPPRNSMLPSAGASALSAARPYRCPANRRA